MKKIFILIFVFFIFAGCCFATTRNSYDQYGSKTGSFRTNGSTINQYDKYGRKVGSYR